MFIAKLGRWLGAVSVASLTAVVVASCGSGAGGSAFGYGDGGHDSSFIDDVSVPDSPGLVGREGSTGCTPKTCASEGWQCGENGDGCGNILNCGTCDYPAYCGGGGYSKCGGNITIGRDGGPICNPTTCASLGYDCGVNGDGCGNVLNCGACTDPQYCGGGGFHVCGGTNGLPPDGAPPGKPTTCTKLGYNCGTAADGCGGLLQCGSCTDPQYCGGGGFDVCGGSNGLGPDGAPPASRRRARSKGLQLRRRGRRLRRSAPVRHLHQPAVLRRRRLRRLRRQQRAEPRRQRAVRAEDLHPAPPQLRRGRRRLRQRAEVRHVHRPPVLRRRRVRRLRRRQRPRPRRRHPLHARDVRDPRLRLRRRGRRLRR